ncbi:MAG: flagellar FlbD family protein [Desulfatiglandaceae bacterium]
MIQVTRLDNTPMVVNVEMIRSLRAAPDTVITFTTDDRMMVKEPVEEISKRILDYQRMIHSKADRLSDGVNSQHAV